MARTTKTPLMATVKKLIAEGACPLPVAPEQPDKKKFTGKNPSYFDAQGNLYPIKHSQYREKQPTESEYNEWFVNPINGVGCLGQEKKQFLDLDRKHFASQSKCDSAFWQWYNAHPKLKNARIEKTRSGGYRVWIEFEKSANFTNFAFSFGGQHYGELLGQGRFAVLAPTINYEVLQDGGFAKVESAQVIGLYPTKNDSKSSEQNTVKLTSVQPDLLPISLKKLAKKSSQELWNGHCGEDRSLALTATIKELAGWANFCKSNGIPIRSDVVDLAHKAGKAVRINPDRVDRILKSIDHQSCTPACIHKGGVQAAWDRIESLYPDIHKKLNPNDDNRLTKLTPLQTATKELYPVHEKWLCFDGILYKWSGTHYKKRLDEAEYPRIRNFCDEYILVSDNGKETRPLARPGVVKQILEWVKQGCMVTSDRINPPGINCTNGVLELHWKGKTLITKIVLHDPHQHCYLNQPLVAYKPDTDLTEYKRLMKCLDPDSRTIWERTIAASLDLVTVRKVKGRAVRALLCKGDGSNGKDTLRVMVEMLIGRDSIASCSMRDWQDYDSGRKFGVASLRGKRLSWPSENADVGRIDRLQGLKAAITGDPISFERKHRDPVDESAQAIFLFNLNESPNLVGSLDAIKSRWGIIPFSKTYSTTPSDGQLQADPRFKEDPKFMQREVLPAFLNMLLEQLQALVNEGIDYSHTQDLLNDLQRQSSHLLQFAHDVGLIYEPDSYVTVSELWERLQQWYIDNGTLTFDLNYKGTWAGQSRTGDKNVRGQNQIVSRFLEIFPKAKRGSRRKSNANNYETVILGLKL